MKRLLAIFILTVILFVITACGAEPENKETLMPADQEPPKEYSIYVKQTLSGEYFTEDVREFMWQGQQEADNSAPNELVKTERINGVNVTVLYDATLTTSLGETRHYYESADGKIECVYRADDMSIASVKIYDQDMSVFMDMGLEEYDQYIKSYVSQYQTENWADLSLMCLTHYYVESADYLGRNVVHSFLTEFADNETLDTREFRYIKQYGNCQTTDEIQVLVSIKEKAIRIWFNDHKFDSLNVEIDHDRIDAAILEFLNAYLQEGVTLEGYEQLGSMLMYSHGNLICRVDLNAIFVKNGAREEQSISFIVDIPNPT